MKKLFSVKSITRLLYGIVMLFPMFSILSRVIYVQANQEAYRSYSGTNYIQYSDVSYSDLVVAHRYNFSTLNGVYSSSNTINTGYIGISNVSNIQSTDSYFYTMLENSSTKYIRYYFSTSPTSLYVFDENFNQLYSRGFGVNTLSFDFTLDSYTTELEQNVTFIKSYSSNNYYYIDNAFEYSVDNFVKDNNLGNLDFFSWFSDLFLSNNSVNLLYINFINWYLNYALLVSLGYILFLCLMWFVNVARRILDKGEKFGEGDY